MIGIKNSALGLAMALAAASVVSQAGELSTCLWNGCGVSCSAQADFYTHVNEHVKGSKRDDKSFCCKWSECEKRFTLKGVLKRHIRTHTREESFRCEACGKGFARKGNLDRHISAHTKVKPFKCKTCRREFADKSNLRAHIRTHTKEKPFKCETCGRGFARQYHLKRHKNSNQTCASKAQTLPSTTSTPLLTSPNASSNPLGSELDPKLLAATFLPNSQKEEVFLGNTSLVESYPGEFAPTDLDLDFSEEKNDDKDGLWLVV